MTDMQIEALRAINFMRILIDKYQRKHDTCVCYTNDDMLQLLGVPGIFDDLTASTQMEGVP